MWLLSRPFDLHKRQSDLQFIDLWVPPQLSQSKIASTSSKRAFGLAPAESVLLALRSPPQWPVWLWYLLQLAGSKLAVPKRFLSLKIGHFHDRGSTMSSKLMKDIGDILDWKMLDE